MRTLPPVAASLSVFCPSLAHAAGQGLAVSPAGIAALLLAGAALCAGAAACVLLVRLRTTRRALNDTEQCYQVLAEHSADFIWRIDEQRRVSFVSPAVERLLGYTPEEFRALALAGICAPDSREAMEQAFKGESCSTAPALEEPSPCVELQLLRKDGSCIWTETSLTPLCGAHGLQGHVCVTRDIENRKTVERSLEEERQRFRAMAENHVDPLLIVDERGAVLFGNSAALELFQASQQNLRDQTFGFPVINAGPAELDIMTPSGDCAVYEMRATGILWEGSQAQLVSLRDVTRRKRIEEALRGSEERYRTVAEHTYDCETWIGPQGDLLYASPSCERITGYSLEQFSSSARFLAGVVHPEDLPLWEQHLQTCASQGQAKLDYRITTNGGEVRWMCQTSHTVQDMDGHDLGIRCTIRDITPRKEMEEQLRHQALHDPLTGLGNRLLCLDRIRQGLERAKRREDYFYAVVFLGLDRFKLINESLGHSFGDSLLREVSSRLGACVRHLDTVARFEGDEFVIFLEELASPREATTIVKRICEALREPCSIDAKTVRITASMGVVLSPADYSSPEDLLRNANIAMRHAKEAGRDRFKIFTGKMLEHAMRQLHLENDLRRGIDNQEFVLAYQPIVLLQDGALLGFEALVRWQHPEKGLISPGAFIPMAEETGLIIDLGAWVLRQACSQFARLLEAQPGRPSLYISINISGRQFSEPGLVEVVKRSLQETGVPPQLVKLEITETTIMDNPEMAAEKLQRLKNLGVTLSIDDFGTGYSSLSYLQRFPLDNLKIDLSFVRMMESAPENIEIVKAIIDLAHTLGLEVVAEGVENMLQQQTLASLGCEYAQGFHFSRPMHFEDALELVRRLPAPRARTLSQAG